MQYVVMVITGMQDVLCFILNFDWWHSRRVSLSTFSWCMHIIFQMIYWSFLCIINYDLYLLHI